MSGAILAGMIQNGVSPKQIIATNRSVDKQEKLHQEYGIITELDNAQAIKKADVVILGLKPQMMLALLTDLTASGVSFKDKLVITVAAGLLSQSYTDIIGKVRFIRSMPNTPSMIGLGMSGLFNATDTTSYPENQIQQDNEVAEQLFAAVGKSIWLSQESQIDEVAAVSGSGPAYFFLFMESMINKAQEFGFSEEDAKEMVLQTAHGAAQMAYNNEIDVKQLRKNVTSPRGSTASAIEVFEQKTLQNTVALALDAAVQRAKELSKL